MPRRTCNRRSRHETATQASARSPIPRRGVENPTQADRVAGIVQHPQVGDDVANLLAFVKSNATHDFVRDAGADEHVFQSARGVVGAIEDGEVVAGDAAPVGERVDLARDEPGLVVFVVGDVADDQFIIAGLGPQPLLPAAGITGDDRVGSRRMVCVER